MMEGMNSSIFVILYELLWMPQCTLINTKKKEKKSINVISFIGMWKKSYVEYSHLKEETISLVTYLKGCFMYVNYLKGT
jgi:hypothetical protein